MRDRSQKRGPWTLARAWLGSGLAIQCEARRWEKAQALVDKPRAWPKNELGAALEAAWEGRAPPKLMLDLLRLGAKPFAPGSLPGMFKAWCESMSSPHWARELALAASKSSQGRDWLKAQATPDALRGLVGSKALGWARWSPQKEEEQALRETLQALVEAGAVDEGGLDQALAWACGWEQGWPERSAVSSSAVAALLEVGARPSSAALAGAAAGVNAPAFALLVQAGADPRERGPWGRRPLGELCAGLAQWSRADEEDGFWSIGEEEMREAFDAAMEPLELDEALERGEDGKTAREHLSQATAARAFFDEAFARHRGAMLARQERSAMEAAVAGSQGSPSPRPRL